MVAEVSGGIVLPSFTTSSWVIAPVRLPLRESQELIPFAQRVYNSTGNK
jgi:hypothetical protein